MYSRYSKKVTPTSFVLPTGILTFSEFTGRRSPGCRFLSSYRIDKTFFKFGFLGCLLGMKCCLTIDLNWSSSTNSLFVMQTLANSQVSELIAKHWIEGQSFYQLRRIQNSWIGRQACLETFWVVSSCFQVFASFCPLSPPFLHPFNYNFQTVSVIFLRLFTYGEFLSHFYRAQYIKSNVKMQYIHKTFPFYIRFFNPFQKQKHSFRK